MDTAELIHALRRITPADCNCFGCGHEHNCRSNGCALALRAADTIEALSNQFEMARAERDVVTRRMIELETLRGGAHSNESDFQGPRRGPGAP